MAYIYRHIRLDKNEPFYIGIGTSKYYNRAYRHNNRSNFWKRIANKGGYEVEILMDNLTWEQACKKEKEFIKLYGRIDLKTGCLVNMTDGGEGTFGLKKGPLSEEIKQKISNANKGKKLKPLSEEHKQKLSDIKKGSKMSEQAKKIMSDAAKGKKLSKDHKQQISNSNKGIPKSRAICPLCLKEGSINNMKRYHFDNCKNNLINDFEDDFFINEEF